MKLLRYACIHMRRAWRETLLTLLTYIMVLALIMTAQQSALSRQATLDDMASNIPVIAQLTDPQGNRTTGLQILNTDLNPYREGGRWAEYVGELNIGAVASEYGRIIRREGETERTAATASIVGVTSDLADPALENAVIDYPEGYDRTVWATMENVCLITEDLQAYVTEGEDGAYIDARFTLSQSAPGSGRSYYDVEMMLKVIGVVPGKRTVFCPFYLVKQEMYDQGGRYTLNTDRLAFTFADNARIDDFRDTVKSYYVVPDQMRPNFNHMLGLVIKDARYLQLVQEAEKNLAIFQLMQPILYLCAIFAGVLLMVMQMRARRREIAILRSVGAGMGRVIAQCLLEYALLCLPVTCVAPLVWRLLPFPAAAGVLLTFLAGALLAMLFALRTPLSAQIRTLEE